MRKGDKLIYSGVKWHLLGDFCTSSDAYVYENLVSFKERICRPISLIFKYGNTFYFLEMHDGKFLSYSSLNDLSYSQM